ncbi:MAG: dicarboxylate/amino acid:cation symporter [Proteobacteria bacterium]|nr:dicarboxylate/amino acid:cation symporter [Pseudomonadota bacterium]
MKLTTKILIAMMLGILLGVTFNLLKESNLVETSLIDIFDSFVIEGLFEVIGKIFVASLKMMVVPLVFISLVLGTSALGNNTRMGPMAGKAIILYLITTSIAISLAIIMANAIDPGVGMDRSTDVEFTGKEAPPLKDVFVEMVPTNPVLAMAEGNMLQIIIFSILMGIALSKVGEKGKQVLQVFESANAIVMKMVLILMHLAPIGVFALLARLFSEIGITAIWDLAAYFFTVLFVLLLHGTVIYGTFIAVFGKLSATQFFYNVKPAIIFAFSTASSNATIPVSMEVAEKRQGVRKSVSSFVVPLGATINMDGTAIMQGVATVFIAQAYNVEIGLAGYLTVILTATLASIGTAGVPGVGLIMLSMVLQQVGLPVEGIALILGVDRLLDMVRTSVNVTGDSMVSTIVAKSENLLDDTTFHSRQD